MTAIRSGMLMGRLCCALVAAYGGGVVRELFRNFAGTISMIVEDGSLDVSDGNSARGLSGMGFLTT